MHLEVGHGEVRVIEASKEELDALKKALKVYAKEPRSPSGFIVFNLYYSKEKAFPTGYLPRVIERLKKKDIHPTITDARTYPEPSLRFSRKNGKKLTPWEWQENALKEIEKNPVGIISGPTGTGKTHLIAETIAYRRVPTLVIVPTVAIQKKMVETLKAYLGGKNVTTHFPRIGQPGDPHYKANQKHQEEGDSLINRTLAEIYTPTSKVGSSPTQDPLGGLFKDSTHSENNSVGLRSIYSNDYNKEPHARVQKKVSKQVGLKRTPFKAKDPYDKPVVVVCFQSLQDMSAKYLSRFQCVIVDEYHHSSASSIRRALNKMSMAAYRYGYSATPWRDKKHEMILLESALGGRILYTYEIKEAIEDGVIEKPSYTQISSAPPQTYLGKTRNWRAIVDEGLIGNEGRNKQISTLAIEEYQRGNNVLICIDEIAHANALFSIMSAMGVNPLIVHGQMNESVAEKHIETISTSRGPLISIATMAIGEGADLVGVNRVILGSGGQGSIRFIQRIGRSLRLKDGGGVKIFDFRDSWNPVLSRHSTARWILFQKHYAQDNKTDNIGLKKIYKDD